MAEKGLEPMQCGSSLSSYPLHNVAWYLSKYFEASEESAMQVSVGKIIPGQRSSQCKVSGAGACLG